MSLVDEFHKVNLFWRKENKMLSNEWLQKLKVGDKVLVVGSGLIVVLDWGW